MFKLRGMARNPQTVHHRYHEAIRHGTSAHIPCINCWEDLGVRLKSLPIEPPPPPPPPPKTFSQTLKILQHLSHTIAHSTSTSTFTTSRLNHPTMISTFHHLIIQNSLPSLSPQILSRPSHPSPKFLPHPHNPIDNNPPLLPTFHLWNTTPKLPSSPFRPIQCNTTLHSFQHAIRATPTKPPVFNLQTMPNNFLFFRIRHLSFPRSPQCLLEKAHAFGFAQEDEVEAAQKWMHHLEGPDRGPNPLPSRGLYTLYGLLRRNVRFPTIPL